MEISPLSNRILTVQADGTWGYYENQTANPDGHSWGYDNQTGRGYAEHANGYAQQSANCPEDEAHAGRRSKGRGTRTSRRQALVLLVICSDYHFEACP